MTGQQLIERARSFVGKITHYAMGQDTATTEDCTAFMWHVLGGKKDQGGVWWNTDRIYGDATGAQTQFERLDGPEAGCLCVYGSRQNGGKAGHIALLVDPTTWTIIDCSSSQDGVHEHDGHYWAHHVGAVFCRYKFPGEATVDLTLDAANEQCVDPDFFGPPVDAAA